jgi:hypothetical protein
MDIVTFICQITPIITLQYLQTHEQWQQYTYIHIHVHFAFLPNIPSKTGLWIMIDQFSFVYTLQWDTHKQSSHHH